MDERLAHLARRCEAAPYHRLLGLAVEELTAAHARLRLPHRELTHNRNGTLHGGVSASLADAAGALAAGAASNGTTALERASVDLTVAYVAPCTTPSVVADARVLRRGRGLVHVDVTLTDADGAPVLKGLVLQRVAPPEPRLLVGPTPAPIRFPVEGARRSGSPFTQRLGVSTHVLGRGHAAVLLPFRDELCDADGQLHEGAVAALVDCAGGAASWMVDGFDGRGRAWTIGMHLAFHGAARGGDLLAEARTVGAHGGVLFNAVLVRERASGVVVANGTITYRIVRPGEPDGPADAPG